MNDVVIGDIMHEMLAGEAKVAVDCRCCALQECPGFRFVLRHLRMCMVQVGNRHDPVIHP